MLRLNSVTNYEQQIMKKLLLLILVTFSWPMKAQTSVYHPFPDSNAVWNYQYILNCSMGYAEEYYSLTILGDTTISAQSYHKLFIPHVQSFSSGTCEFHSIGYKGAFREDTLNRKVFFIPPFQSSEQLLYDFSLQVGDTIQGYLDYFGLPSTIQIIDSILIGSTFRKRWILSCYGIQIIEGIGNTYGLIEYLPGCATDFPDYTLTCFSQNEETLYPDIASNCELISNIKGVSDKIFISTLFPNPFNSTATLTLNSDFGIAELKIFNALGKEVGRQNINSFSTTINREGLSNGIYFYQVATNNRQLTSGKFTIE